MIKVAALGGFEFRVYSRESRVNSIYKRFCFQDINVLWSSRQLPNKVNLIFQVWKEVNKQVCGYAQKYEEGLVIVTVKGAGHMVPQDKRAASYKMFSSFIKGILLYEDQ